MMILALSLLCLRWKQMLLIIWCNMNPQISVWPGRISYEDNILSSTQNHWRRKKSPKPNNAGVLHMGSVCLLGLLVISVCFDFGQLFLLGCWNKTHGSFFSNFLQCCLQACLQHPFEPQITLCSIAFQQQLLVSRVSWQQTAAFIKTSPRKWGADSVLSRPINSCAGTWHFTTVV